MKVRAVTVVCSSDAQLDAGRRTLRHLGIDGYVPACRIYNAVDDDLVPDGTPVDREKLVFSGPPGEDLAMALDAFRAMRRAMPALRLCVATSALLRGPTPRIDGVTWLRPQPLSRIHEETRSALCSLVPNLSNPDSFGQAIAESLAVGTPVLAHDIGCSGELVRDPRQLLPAPRSLRACERVLQSLPSALRAVSASVAARAGLFDAYIERVRAWRESTRPETGPDPRFQLARIADEWRSLLAA